jgi:hypothetical protein
MQKEGDKCGNANANANAFAALAHVQDPEEEMPMKAREKADATKADCLGKEMAHRLPPFAKVGEKAENKEASQEEKDEECHLQNLVTALELKKLVEDRIVLSCFEMWQRIFLCRTRKWRTKSAQHAGENRALTQ